MSTQREDVLADYRALRRDVGAYRLPRDVLAVTGPDAFAYLQGQCSQDLEGLGVGQAADALLLEPDGKLTALVRVLRTGGDRFAVDVDAGFGELVAARLARFRLRTKVTIEPLDWECVALRGAGVDAAHVGAAAPAGGPWPLPFDWGGVRGVDLLGPAAEAAVPSGARWCGPEAWEALRIEAGIPVMGKELDGRTIAAEAGLVERTVSLTKGCYTGQELVARLDARGSKVARRLVGLVFRGAGEDGGALDPGEVVGAELAVPDRERPVGVVTSAAWCPGVGGVAGLGYLHRSVAVPGVVGVRREQAPGESRAEVCSLPFEIR